MRSTVTAMLALLIVATPGDVVRGDTASETRGVRAFTGSFVWDQGAFDGDLEAEFTPSKKPERWEVTFRFQFRGDRHEYAGTARGLLDEGRLRGRVHNENRTRTFTFEGRFVDGEFRGTHAETTSGSSNRTGTWRLEPVR